jgi:hypothetical protein
MQVITPTIDSDHLLAGRSILNYQLKLKEKNNETIYDPGVIPSDDPIHVL